MSTQRSVLLRAVGLERATPRAFLELGLQRTPTRLSWVQLQCGFRPRVWKEAAPYAQDVHSHCLPFGGETSDKKPPVPLFQIRLSALRMEMQPWLQGRTGSSALIRGGRELAGRQRAVTPSD